MIYIMSQKTHKLAQSRNDLYNFAETHKLAQGRNDLYNVAENPQVSTEP